MKYIVWLFILAISIQVAIGETYYPFRDYTIDGDLFFVSLAGSKENYSLDPIYVQYGGGSEIIKRGFCKYMGNKRICYNGGALNLTNNIGNYDKYFGEIPELYLVISDQEADLHMTVETGIKSFSPGKKFYLNITLDNQGNVVASDTKLLIKFNNSKIVSKDNPALIDTGTTYSANIGGIENGESITKSYGFEIPRYVSGNFFVDIWANYYSNGIEKNISDSEDYEKVQAILIKLNTDQASYGVNQNIDINLVVTKISKGVNIKEITLLAGEGMQYFHSSKEPDISKFNDRSLTYTLLNSETNTLDATYRPRYIGNYTIQAYVKYEVNDIIFEESTSIPINVKVEEPYLKINITDNLQSLAKYMFVTELINPSDQYYYKNLECNLSSIFYIDKTYVLDFLYKGNYTIINKQIQVPPVFAKKEYPLIINCTYQTQYNQSLKIGDYVNVNITPINYSNVTPMVDEIMELIKMPKKSKTKKVAQTPPWVTKKKTIWQKLFGWTGLV